MVQSECIRYRTASPRILNINFLIIVGIVGACTLMNLNYTKLHYESNLLDIDWEKLTETPF